MAPRSSRQRYNGFVEDYKRRQLDDEIEARDRKALVAPEDEPAPAPDKSKKKAKRREYMRDYFRWLWPYRYAVGVLAVLALARAGMEMIEPLFMRFIIDRVLLVKDIDSATRIMRLNGAGALFLALIIFSNLLGS
jgi:ATP-binding cassette subfamily B protein/subfamily B ATP-binding cassette protein MsbA